MSISDYNDYNDYNDLLTNCETWMMTLRSSDLQSDSDLNSIRNSCDVSCISYWRIWNIQSIAGNNEWGLELTCPRPRKTLGKGEAMSTGLTEKLMYLLQTDEAWLEQSSLPANWTVWLYAEGEKFSYLSLLQTDDDIYINIYVETYENVR